MFPLIIHQIWFQSKNQIPEKYHKNIERTRRSHPNFQYVLWDDQMIQAMLQSNKTADVLNGCLEKYKSFKFLHQKVDFAKYIILYLYGGIYIDMDAYAIRSVEPLMREFSNYQMIVCSTDMSLSERLLVCRSPTFINNGIILAKPGATALKRLIRHILTLECHWPFNNQYSCIQHTTGPCVFSQILGDDPTIKLLAPEYLEPCVRQRCQITANTYIVHQHAQTWIDGRLQKVIDLYLDHKKVVIPAIMIGLLGAFLIAR